MSVASPGPKFFVQARLKEFVIPPMTDGLVLGRKASISTAAVQKALHLLIPDHFEHLTLDDEIIADVLIRSILLRRLTKDRLVTFLMAQIKPFMSSGDILQLQLDLAITLTEELE